MTILGTVDIRDFDAGCMHTIGAEVAYFTIDGSPRAQYVVDLPGVDSGLDRYEGKIPVANADPNSNGRLTPL